MGITGKGLDSQASIVDVSQLQKIQLDTSKFAGIASSTSLTNSTNFFEYEGFIAVEDGVNDFGDEL